MISTDPYTPHAAVQMLVFSELEMAAVDAKQRFAISTQIKLFLGESTETIH